MKEDYTVCWLSGGVSSFIAGYMYKDAIDEFIYIDIENQHPDTYRFIKDCERALNKKVTILQSPYKNVENCIRTSGVIKMPFGFAPCTNWLKKRVRKLWELNHKNYNITYVWGFDKKEIARKERLEESMPQFNHIFPLITLGITKEESHSILEELGIKRPIMYDLGYPNNNCIGCIKGGMGYWNKIRKDFPDVFEKYSKLEREIGHSILKECYLDELDPERGKNKIVVPDCGINCQLALDIIREV